VNEQLLKWANEGYAPTLLYDDDGHWAVCFSGMMSMEDAAIQQTFSGVELLWRDTPEDAVMSAVGWEDEL